MDRNSRLPSLTGLRWAAALIVFGQHILEQYYNSQLVAAKPVRSAVWALLAHGGGLGVSFFFVLSGFVLAWSARPGERAGRFWWRRFSKVYPAALVTTLAAVVIVGGAGPLQLATHLTLTQSWLPAPRRVRLAQPGQLVTVLRGVLLPVLPADPGRDAPARPGRPVGDRGR